MSGIIEAPLTAFTDLMAAMVAEGGGFGVDLPADWLQGRTAYGGLTAALCVAAAHRHAPDLPPLRSAQFALIGPTSGRLSIIVNVLRRGKSSVVVGVDIAGDGGPSARALLAFGASRPSALNYLAVPLQMMGNPEDHPPYFRPGAGAPGFAVHFSTRMMGGSLPFNPGAEPEFLIALRHNDPAARQGVVGLIALADALPSPALVLFPDRAPFSTMTWSLDFLSDDLTCPSGWWLARSTTDSAASGYSTQTMTLWDDQGRPVIVGRQNVAVFI